MALPLESLSTTRLTELDLFRGLDHEALVQLLTRAGRRQAARDSFFFQQGDPAAVLYVLGEGQVKLTQVSPDGSQVVLRFISPGEMFGMIGALGEKAYPASAEAVVDSIALVWESETLTQLMETYPPLATNALRHLARRVQELQEHNLELTTQRVERRIAHALVRLAQARGRKVEAGILIDLPLSRQDLAEMTGTTLYTVSRTLSLWQQQGLVEAGRERVVIRSPHGLVSIAEDLPGRESE